MSKSSFPAGTLSAKPCRMHGKNHQRLARAADQITKAWQANGSPQPPEYEHGVPDLPDLICVSEAEFAASIIDFCNLLGARGAEQVIHGARRELAVLRAQGMAPYGIAKGLIQNQHAHGHG